MDLAKTVFRVVVADERGKITERRRLTRARFERFCENRASYRVLMEACGSAHHWGRWLMARGFDVTLLPAHSVTPYVQRNKTDERDAEGLLEAVRSPRGHESGPPAAGQRPITTVSFEDHAMCDIPAQRIIHDGPEQTSSTSEAGYTTAAAPLTPRIQQPS